MDSVQLKYTAINMRESGLSYGEIMKRINVPKSTLSYWLREFSLDDRQRASLKARSVEKQKRGRFSTSIALRARKVFKEKVVFDEAEREFNIFCKPNKLEDISNSFSSAYKVSFFLTGIALYWADGAMKGNHFQFVNSDPEMIKLMTKWLGNYLKINKNEIKYRIFVKEAYTAQNIDNFWCRELKIPKESLKTTIQKRSLQYSAQQPRIAKINPYYKGSCMITVTKVAILRKILAWQSLLIKYYKGQVPGHA